MPMTQSDSHHARPIYEELPGWWEDISAARSFDDVVRAPVVLERHVRRAVAIIDFRQVACFVVAVRGADASRARP